MMILLFALLTAASVPQDAAPTAAPKKDPVVCRGDSVTGSRLAKKPQCKKQSEWAAQDAANSAKVARERDNRPQAH